MDASTLFWVLVIVGGCVLVTVYVATNEQEHRRKRRLRRIRKRLEKIDERRREGEDQAGRDA